ncbi:hypothetical protein D3C75_516840 [compost metagenome]
MEQFRGFGRHHDGRAAGAYELVQQVINFLLGTFVDAASRFVAQQADRLSRQAFGKHDLLLIAATHGFHWQIEG